MGPLLAAGVVVGAITRPRDERAPVMGTTSAVGLLEAVDVTTPAIYVSSGGRTTRIRLRRAVRIRCGAQPLTVAELGARTRRRVKVWMVVGAGGPVATDITVAASVETRARPGAE